MRPSLSARDPGLFQEIPFETDMAAERVSSLVVNLLAGGHWGLNRRWCMGASPNQRGSTALGAQEQLQTVVNVACLKLFLLHHARPTKPAAH